MKKFSSKKPISLSDLNLKTLQNPFTFLTLITPFLISLTSLLCDSCINGAIITKSGFSLG